MESNSRKLKGLAKGKLVMMSLYRASSKPPSKVQQHNPSTGKVKPSPLPSSMDFTVSQDHLITPPKQRALPPSSGSAEYILNRDQVTPQPTILLQESSRCDASATVVDSLYGFAVDENVDTEAASYISSVRERFRLQRINSENKKFQDVPH